jgi:hypothetical protein
MACTAGLFTLTTLSISGRPKAAVLHHHVAPLGRELEDRALHGRWVRVAKIVDGLTHIAGQRHRVESD